MRRRNFLAGAGALAAGAAAAQGPAGPVRVELQTAEGRILVEVYPDKAPITAGRFLQYVDEKRLDGASFYRASRIAGAPEFGLVQGGTQNDPKRVLKPIAHEPTTLTGLSHRNGTLSVGRFAPGTATGEFFVCVGDLTSLDADPKAPGDNQGFAAFGKVLEGMDVVKKILAAPTDANAGTGAMKGEMLTTPVRIVTARRVG